MSRLMIDFPVESDIDACLERSDPLRANRPVSGARKKRVPKSYDCTCQECGVIFEASKSTAKYCSQPCRKEGNRERELEYSREYEFKKKKRRAEAKLLRIKEEFGIEFILEVIEGTVE